MFKVMFLLAVFPTVQGSAMDMLDGFAKDFKASKHLSVLESELRYVRDENMQLKSQFKIFIKDTRSDFDSRFTVLEAENQSLRERLHTAEKETAVLSAELDSTRDRASKANHELARTKRRSDLNLKSGMVDPFDESCERFSRSFIDAVSKSSEVGLLGPLLSSDFIEFFQALEFEDLRKIVLNLIPSDLREKSAELFRVASIPLLVDVAAEFYWLDGITSRSLQTIPKDVYDSYFDIIGIGIDDLTRIAKSVPGDRAISVSYRGTIGGVSLVVSDKTELWHVYAMSQEHSQSKDFLNRRLVVELMIPEPDHTVSTHVQPIEWRRGPLGSFVTGEWFLETTTSLAVTRRFNLKPLDATMLVQLLSQYVFALGFMRKD